MPRGGRRPGAGRPPGAVTQKTRETANAIAASGATPLNYMLAVIADPSAAQRRKDEMAKSAAPFVHPRLNALATLDASAPVGRLEVNIVSVPSGCQFNAKTGLIEYPDGTVAEPPAFQPFTPTPDLPALPAPAAVDERLPVIEPEGEEPIVRLDCWRDRNRDDDETPGAA
jgi:hypothetical protein